MKDKIQKKKNPATEFIENIESSFKDHVDPELDEGFWGKVAGKAEKKPKKVLTSFYLEKDLHDLIDELYQIHGKGFKSKLINESLRYTLTDKGLLK